MRASEDNWSRIADGIQFRDTPGHGFVVLNAVRMDEMREEYPMLLSEENLHGMPDQFEEDCEWSRVFCAFWRELDPKSVTGAVKTLARWYPIQFSEWIRTISERGEIEELYNIVPPETEVSSAGRDSPIISLSVVLTP